MTREEWDNLSLEEHCALSEEVRLKHFIKFTEERYISYKKMLEDFYKDKTVYEPGDWRIEFGAWFKEHLREMKNSEESSLKELRLQMEYCRADMSPPSHYFERWKKKRVQCHTCEGKGVILEVNK